MAGSARFRLAIRPSDERADPAIRTAPPPKSRACCEPHSDSALCLRSRAAPRPRVRRPRPSSPPRRPSRATAEPEASALEREADQHAAVGRRDLAAPLYARAIELRAASDARASEARALAELAVIEHDRGDLERGRALLPARARRRGDGGGGDPDLRIADAREPRLAARRARRRGRRARARARRGGSLSRGARNLGDAPAGERRARGRDAREPRAAAPRARRARPGAFAARTRAPAVREDARGGRSHAGARAGADGGLRPSG